MHALRTERHMAEGDLADVRRLLDLAEVADGRRPLSDHVFLDLMNGGGHGFAGVIATESGAEQPIGYAEVTHANDARVIELVIDPADRTQIDTIGAELLDVALGVVAADGGGRINWWVFEPDEAHHSLAKGAGLYVGRTLYQMRRSLPTGLAVTIDTRDFVPGHDDDAWLAVNNRAFAVHGEQGGWTAETLHQRIAEPWFDAAGFRVYERDDRMAGFCWTKVHPPSLPDDDALGEIYVIAVDPDFHGLGLGTQLTLAGLEHLAKEGIATALLYVDADNSTAVALYRKLGFEVAATNVAFEAEVAP